MLYYFSFRFRFGSIGQIIYISILNIVGERINILYDIRAGQNGPINIDMVINYVTNMHLIFFLIGKGYMETQTKQFVMACKNAKLYNKECHRKMVPCHEGRYHVMTDMICISFKIWLTRDSCG